MLAYLGEAFDDSDVSIDFVSEHAASLTSPSTPFVGLGPGIASSPQQRAINRILERAYFERVWIVQEIECAREVEIIIGGKSVDWRAFSISVFYVESNKKLHFGDRYHGRISTVVSYLDISTVEKPETLLQFLDDTHHCKSSDPRGKAYALLAMMPEAKEQTLMPDYFLPYRDLFILLARKTSVCSVTSKAPPASTIFPPGSPTGVLRGSLGYLVIQRPRDSTTKQLVGPPPWSTFRDTLRF